MGFFSSPTNILIIAIGTALIVLSGLFYLYYNSSQGKIKILTENVAKMEIVAQTQKETINKMENEMQAQADATKKNQEEVAKIREDTSKLSKLLAKHDLAYLAANKPGLIENRVNTATKQTFKELEEISKGK